MLPLLFAAALIDTVCVIDDPDWNTIIIHEWGVVTRGEQLVASSVPDEYRFEFDSPASLEDKAPVITFYGSPFTDALFSVELHTGRFTEVSPLPEGASLDDRVFQWEIVSAENMGDSYEIPASSLPESRSSSGWAYDDWRDGQAHVIDFAGGIVDRFIYYECSIPFGPDDPFLPFDPGRGIHRDFEGEILVFEPGLPDGMRIFLCSNNEIAASSDLMQPYSRDAVLDILCSWSSGRLKSDEITDMWDAWETWILTEQWSGDRLLVFELPQGAIEGISTLNLETNGTQEISIERFYLGMSPFYFTF